MNVEVAHEFLVPGEEPEGCRARVKRFLETNQLLRYQEVEIPPESCVNALHPEFRPRLEAGIAANRRVLGRLLAELAEQGFGRTEELVNLEQGFASKTLHTIAHLLDGFIGIDSAFYNLADDSHWVSRVREELIKKEPQACHLVRAVGRCHGASPDLTCLIRGFEDS